MATKSETPKSFNARIRAAEHLFTVLLAAGLLSLYLYTLLPGVGYFDTGDIQWTAPLFGMAHPPGYGLLVSFGWIFVKIVPFGSIAWRMNLLSALSGVAGALLLYGTLRRITGSAAAGVLGALVLALSSVYWLHSVIAEVYVFYAAFLLGSLYGLTRCVESDDFFWLALAALCAGIAIADRMSELLILPALLSIVVLNRPDMLRRVSRLATLAFLFLLPFLVTVSVTLMRADPDTVGFKDDAYRNAVLGDSAREVTLRTPPGMSGPEKFMAAVRFCSGFNWAKGWGDQSGVNFSLAPEVLSKLFVVYSGTGLFRQADADPSQDTMLQGGVTAGFPVLILCIAALFGKQERRRWVVAGGLFIGGNLLFILIYPRWDNLTFTIPGLIGLSVLAGLGFDHLRSNLLRTKGRQMAVFVAIPAFLVAANIGPMNRKTPAEATLQARFGEIRDLPWPKNTVILADYYKATALRYLLYVEKGRRDIWVLTAERHNRARLSRHLADAGRAYVITDEFASPAVRATLTPVTPQRLLSLGFLHYRPSAMNRRQ